MIARPRPAESPLERAVAAIATYRKHREHRSGSYVGPTADDALGHIYGEDPIRWHRMMTRAWDLYCERYGVPGESGNARGAV